MKRKCRMNVKNDLELEKEIASIVNIIEDKKGQDVKVYDMRGKSPFFDYSILCTGSSSRNIEAIASDIKKSLTTIRNVEGLEECNWVLIDAGDIIVSVFSKDAREYYQLDAFYSGVSGNQTEEEID
jgi:iojap-like protein